MCLNQLGIIRRELQEAIERYRTHRNGVLGQWDSGEVCEEVFVGIRVGKQWVPSMWTRCGLYADGLQVVLIDIDLVPRFISWHSALNLRCLSTRTLECQQFLVPCFPGSPPTQMASRCLRASC